MRERTLYVIIGLLLGIIIMQWRQGPQTAQAQAPGVVVGNFANDFHYVLLDNGDVYSRMIQQVGGFPKYVEAESRAELNYVGNFWTSPPVPTSNETWGSLKEKFDGKD